MQSTRQTKAGAIVRNLDFGLTSGDLITFAIVTEMKCRKTGYDLTSSVYHLKRIPTDFGVGVEVTKQDAAGELYHVHLDRQLGDSCTCPAGVYRGACRHLDMVREAHRLGLV